VTELAIQGVIPAWTLTDRLRKAREYRGLTQAELANLTGISARSVHNYEAGYTAPRRPQLVAWAMATGVALQWLEEPVRPKGLEPLTFWSGVWRAWLATVDLGRRRPGRSCWRWVTSEHGGAVRGGGFCRVCGARIERARSALCDECQDLFDDEIAAEALELAA
jgi:transcriptional regulator with XRE-family HTH domain